MVIKTQLSKAVMKELLLRKVITTEMGKMVTTISNGYLKAVKTISNNHLKKIVIERPLTLRIFFYLGASTVHVPPINFLLIMLSILSNVQFVFYSSHCHIRI
jgi:hypothetical protein